MGYLFGAYLVLWGVTFGYIWMLGGRQRRLEQEIASLQRDTAEDLD
jgi:CcmD family protein